MPLLFNDDVAIGVVKPTVDDPSYSSTPTETSCSSCSPAAARCGASSVICLLGRRLRVHPRGALHRIVLAAGLIDALSIECKGGLGIPRQWRNEVGQLRMDAPYSHRDFQATHFRGSASTRAFASCS
jgi:homogentisate 1,2-dioxygenase